MTNTLANGIAQAASMLSALVFMPFLVRAFGTELFGLYMLATAVNSYAALLDFGVGIALAKMIAEKASLGDREGVGRLVSGTLAYYVVIGVIASAVLLGIALSSGSLFHTTPAGATLLRNLLLVAAAMALFVWPAATANYVLAGYQRYTVTARISLGVTMANIAATLLTLWLHQGPLFLFAAAGLVSLTGALVTVMIASRQLGGVKVSPLRAEASTLKKVFRFSWAVSVAQIATIIVYQQTDRLVLGVFLGGAAIGLYEAAGKFLGFVSQLSNVANSAVMPMASGLDAAGKKEALEALIYRGTRYVVAIIAPVVVVLMVLARPIIASWLGPQFEGQALAAAILVSPWLLMINTTVADNVLIAKGLLAKRLPYIIAVSAGNLILSVILVQRFGILGVVIGTAAPWWIDYPLHVRLLRRQLDLKASDMLRLVLIRTYPPLLVSLVIAVAALYTPLTRSLLGTGVAAAVAVAAYWAAFLATNSQERGEVIGAIAAAVSRFAPRR